MEISLEELNTLIKKDEAKIHKPEGFQFRNQLYKNGDNIVIKLLKKKKEQNYYVKLIETILIEQEDGKLISILNVQFYFSKFSLPEKHKNFFKHISVNELFLSDLCQFVSLDTIVGSFILYNYKQYVNSTEDKDIKFMLGFFDTETGKIKPPLDERKKTCVCNKIENPDFNYIMCEACENWFHYSCAGIKDNLNVTDIHFKCKDCEEKDDN